MSDLIDRQAAIDALGEEPPVWYDGDDEIAESNQWRRDVAAIESLPSASPDLSEEDMRLIKKLRSFHNGSYAVVLDKLITSACNKTKRQATASSNCISRQAAIDAINAYLGLSAVSRTIQNMTSIQEILEKLPSAEPRKKGKWIKIPEFCGDDVSGFIDNHFSCSECKKEAEINPWGFYILSDFCPNCGADMREGEEE